MALTGNEILNVTGIHGDGSPAPITQPVKASVIAQLSVAGRGTFTANGSTPVAVAFPGMARALVVTFGLNTAGGTVGAYPTTATITPGTGFTVVATVGDTSIYNWIAE